MPERRPHVARQVVLRDRLQPACERPFADPLRAVAALSGGEGKQREADERHRATREQRSPGATTGERGPVARSRASAIVRPAHGVLGTVVVIVGAPAAPKAKGK